MLASSSPRRIELLKRLGFEFTHISPKVEEDTRSLDPIKRVERNSLLKAKSINEKDSVIIGSDTVIFVDGEILGKPVDKRDAIRMLRKLSGKCNKVYSGVTVVNTTNGKILTRHMVSEVWFRKLTDEEINEYVESGEPFGKAGAFGIQGLGGKIVDRIAGSFTNVVGLPLELLEEMLLEIFY